VPWARLLDAQAEKSALRKGGRYMGETAAEYGAPGISETAAK